MAPAGSGQSGSGRGCPGTRRGGGPGRAGVRAGRGRRAACPCACGQRGTERGGRGRTGSAGHRAPRLGAAARGEQEAGPGGRGAGSRGRGAGVSGCRLAPRPHAPRSGRLAQRAPRSPGGGAGRCPRSPPGQGLQGVGVASVVTASRAAPRCWDRVRKVEGRGHCGRAVPPRLLCDAEHSGVCECACECACVREGSGAGWLRSRTGFLPQPRSSSRCVRPPRTLTPQAGDPAPPRAPGTPQFAFSAAFPSTPASSPTGALRPAQHCSARCHFFLQQRKRCLFPGTVTSTLTESHRDFFFKGRDCQTR